jgi:hypothetical protein
MKLCVFAWIPREKPPYFGGMPTWVYIRKFNLNNLEKEKIKNILQKIDDEIGANHYKIIVYDGNRIYKHYFEVGESE